MSTSRWICQEAQGLSPTGKGERCHRDEHQNSTFQTQSSVHRLRPEEVQPGGGPRAAPLLRPGGAVEPRGRGEIRQMIAALNDLYFHISMSLFILIYVKDRLKHDNPNQKRHFKTM